MSRLNKQRDTDLPSANKARQGKVAGAGHQWLSDEDARDLVERARAFDERALSQVYALFADRLFRFVYYRVQDRPHAEELTSQVFVRFLENIGKFKVPVQDTALIFTGWVFTIARNLIIDDARRAGARRADEPLAEDDLESGFDTELHLTRVDLQSALAQLTEEQQTVLLLRFEEGWTTEQIARMMGKTEMAIKALQRRGLAAMARLLR